MYKILDLSRVFSTFQETVWSLLNGQLRYIYDKVSVNVRGLEALGVQSEQ